MRRVSALVTTATRPQRGHNTLETICNNNCPRDRRRQITGNREMDTCLPTSKKRLYRMFLVSITNKKHPV